MSRKEIWIFAEQTEGRTASVYYELLAKATELAKQKNWLVASVVLGSGTDSVVEELKSCSEKVYVVDHLKLADYTLAMYAESFDKLASEYSPEMVLIGATGIGAELAPTLAAKLKTGLAAHCIDIRVDDVRERINCMVPAFGGKVVSEIFIPDTKPMMASVRPGIMEANEVKMECEEVISIDASFLDEMCTGEEFVEFVPNVQTGIKIEDANVIVACGRGVNTETAWSKANEIAAKLDGAVAWSRSFIDNGFVDNEVSMIGTSGKSVKPAVFIGAGISGATHFTCGMGKSKLIINVNKDENAKIFDYSDYGVVGDARKFFEALNEKLTK